MPLITPLDDSTAPEGSRASADAHAATGGRMTNMKWTLAHAPATSPEAVLYLTGPGARYVTGTTLVIDAGLLTR